MEQDTMQAAWKTSELTGINSTYLEELYEEYLDNKENVSPDWQQYFNNLDPKADLLHEKHSVVKQSFINLAKTTHSSKSSTVSNVAASKFAAVMNLIHSYRYVGHQQSTIDPLKLLNRPKPETEDLSLQYHGLSETDLETEFDIKDLGFSKPAKLKDIVAKLKQIYCGNIALEYMHITNIAEKNWLKEQIETHAIKSDISAEKQKWLLQRITAAEGLEKYLGLKYVGQKRFSLEGCDSLIPLLDELVRVSSDNDIEEIIFGMAHRGRLNVLVNTLGKSPERLFQEFEETQDKDFLSGDVKYHMGFSSNMKTEHGKNMRLALAFNPSHLEIVSPVIEGSVKARQAKQPLNPYITMAIHMHGDAAFAGQGVVMETFSMSQTRGYRTGGSIHIVINNQIGFTTSQPIDARSSYYCTGIAKMIEAPIFHVNADDLESVIKVAGIALAYRTKFYKNVVIDLVGYRRHGHNEADEPSATQPLMYKTIKKQLTVRQVYANQLCETGVITKADADNLVTEYRKRLEAGKPVADLIATTAKKLNLWEVFKKNKWTATHSTKLPKKELLKIANKLDSIPSHITLQKQVAKVIKDRVKMTNGELALNWGYAELLAYATLLDSKFPIRLSGEDSGRGTFAHRHSVLHDINTGETFVPLSNLHNDKASFTVIDSLLSEEGVLAFEYGMASSDPNTLVIWEAQFGDFVNGAQVVIDQFISSAQEKWGRLCGLVMYLPHGYEGMGAEHSSARLERFLQMCAHDNMQICVPSTPAQMYHMIRRHMLRPYRKPLIVMTPKSLLRHHLATSTLEELSDGKFNNVILDKEVTNSKDITRVVLCCGKVYYDLLAKKRAEKITNISIIRVEQLYPFPNEEIQNVFSKYEHVTDFIWCQEEPENQGAWLFMQYKLNKTLKILKFNQTIQLAGRKAFAAPAVGYHSLHTQQQEALVNKALQL
ncbi:MAG: 2-oxoglutarate dehydrogenase E1 component [Thiotrichales bacterium]|nr:MAG: 2-oxoglutarate dehydrogenase E1 component [Thiotrichales bacterium]